MHDNARSSLRWPSTISVSRLDEIPGAVLARTVPASGTSDALEALHPDERELAVRIPSARRTAFIAGRVALREALVQSSSLNAANPVLRTSRGAPNLPQGVTGSISHKPSLAVALVAPVKQNEVASVGIDVEERRSSPPFRDLARRILSERELRFLPNSTDEIRYDSTLLCFAAKEAIYKAIDQIMGRHGKLLEFTVQSVTGGIDALGEVTVRVESLTSSDSFLNPQSGADARRTYIGHGTATDIVVAGAHAYIAAVNKLIIAEKREEAANDETAKLASTETTGA